MKVSGQFDLLTLYPGENHHNYHRIEGWMFSRAGLDAKEKRKVSCLCREPNTESAIVQTIA
jgi:hypothetical protein